MWRGIPFLALVSLSIRIRGVAATEVSFALCCTATCSCSRFVLCCANFIEIYCISLTDTGWYSCLALSLTRGIPVVCTNHLLRCHFTEILYTSVTAYVTFDSSRCHPLLDRNVLMSLSLVPGQRGLTLIRWGEILHAFRTIFLNDPLFGHPIAAVSGASRQGSSKWEKQKERNLFVIYTKQERELPLPLPLPQSLLLLLLQPKIVAPASTSSGTLTGGTLSEREREKSCKGGRSHTTMKCRSVREQHLPPAAAPATNRCPLLQLPPRRWRLTTCEAIELKAELTR